MCLSNSDIEKIKNQYENIFSKDFLEKNDIKNEFSEKSGKDIFYIEEEQEFSFFDKKVFKYPLLYCNKSQFKNKLGNIVFSEFVNDSESIFVSTSAIDIYINHESNKYFLSNDLDVESIKFIISYLKYLKIDFTPKYYTNAMMINNNNFKKVIAFSDVRRQSYPSTIFIENTENIFNDDYFIKSMGHLIQAKYNLELDTEYFESNNIHKLREIISCVEY